jgi:hypothetical protein
MGDPRGKQQLRFTPWINFPFTSLTESISHPR